MAKDYTFEVGSARDAKDATIRHQAYGMDIELIGVDPSTLVEMVTEEEIVGDKLLGPMLKALIGLHGLGELIYELVDSNDTAEIIKEVYHADADTVRDWVHDTFSKDE